MPWLSVEAISLPQHFQCKRSKKLERGKGHGAGDAWGLCSPSPSHFVERLTSLKAEVVSFVVVGGGTCYLWG